MKLKIFIFIFAVTSLGTGCSNDKLIKQTSECSSLTNSQKAYILVDQDTDPIEELIKNLANDIRTPLLKHKLNTTIIHKESDVINNGILVSANILRAYRGGLSKRIEVEYKMTYTDTNTEIFRGFESISSKFGYRKISIKIGELISESILTEIKNCE